MEPPLHMSYICYWLPKSPCCYLSQWCEGVSRFRVCESEWMPLNAEYAIDGVNEEEAICGGLITKVSAKKRVRRPKPIGSRARYFHAGG